jgi:predicted ATPase
VCRELTLGFLSEAEVAEYMSREFPGHTFPPDLPRLIHAKTEGSPLFMVDLVSDLRDRGAIEQTADGWTLGQALSEIARDLPESVRGMIERKIAQLSEDDRQLLIAASVQGYEFDSAVLAKVLSLEADVVEQRLEALERVFAFVRLTSEVELPDGTLTLRYRFVHVLYQNALYASLRPTRRASWNGLVAAALMGFYGKRTPDIAAQLAILHTAARNYPAAVEQYLQAAQQATRVFGHAETAVLAESGLQLIDRLPETPERTRAELRLRSRLAGAQMVLQGFGAPDVLATHLRMRELCQALGDDAQRLRTELGLSIVYTVRAEYEKSREIAAGSLHLAERIGDSAMAVQAGFCQGLGSFYLGELQAARQQFQSSLERYDPVRHRPIALYGAVLTRAHLSRTLSWLGYPDSGAALMRDALAASDETRHPIGPVNILSVAVFVEILEGRIATARATSERMIALADEHGYPYFCAIGLVVGGFAMTLETGDDAGIARMRKGLAMHEAAGTWQNHATSLILLADAMRATGRIDEALSTLILAEAAIERTGERYYEPELHRLRGTLILMQNPEAVARAEASFRRAIDVARRQEARSWELRAATSLAHLSREYGGPADGRAMLESVAGWFSEGLESAALRDARVLLDRW